MRPVRIELQGFSAFRDPTVVDLADTDLFALVGPTGAGKSSVIDAMVFALYGAVPRYGSENLVHPVITQGALEARVRLDFLVGEVVHTATRVVRRTKTGASTKEARLERVVGADEPTEVLADDAKGMTAAVTALLGLDLEQFTKCVVLPQGAFATLLHDTKAKRQDLLVKLLDLGVYERVAKRARDEAKRIGFTLESLDEQLDRAAGATPEAVVAIDAELAGLRAVVAELDAAGPALEVHAVTVAELERTLQGHRAALQLLGSVRAPASVADLAAAVADGRAAVDAAEATEAQHAAAVAQAAKVRQALPDVATLSRLRDDHLRLAELGASIAKGTELVDERETQVEPARQRVADAEAACTAAAEVRDRVRLAHQAADLARQLQPGDDCPVCGTEISSLPDHDAAALAAADAAVAAAETRLAELRAELADHERTLAGYRARLDERRAEHEAVLARLAAAPSSAEIDAELAAVAAADAELASARDADTHARQEAARARAALADAEQRATSARAAYAEARDRVAALGPPAASDDLAADWDALVAWAGTAADATRAALEAADVERAAVVEARQAEQRRLLALAADAGVEAADFPLLRDACVAAVASASARRDQLAADVERAAELRTRHAALTERQQVHELLAQSLGARGFEAWLLDEALAVLLEGATAWLEQLSSGRYAMTVDDKNAFAVIDHANADELRLARTLSGGETFLASLALALALAEQVSELSASGGTSLDAIFLDEGFGTLDPGTLDVVATAIEELGATGRMVGVISHVRELAERVPVRFEITKTPGSSTIRRVET